MKCECGEVMEKKRVEVAGILSEGYKCPKCGEVEFTEKQMRKMLAQKEKLLKIAVTRKIGQVGGSLVLRIPRSVEEALNLEKGEDVKIIVENKKMIVQPEA